MMRLRCADEQIAFRKTKTEPFGNYTAENLLSSLFPWFDVHLRTLTRIEFLSKKWQGRKYVLLK